MNADNDKHVVLPFVDRRSATAAFPVARTIARALNAQLHLLARDADLPVARELVRHMPLRPDEQDAFSIDAVAGDLVETTANRLAELNQPMLILAFRLGDEAMESAPQPDAAAYYQMLEQITSPILIVPPDRDLRAWQLRRELLPQDGTPGCAAALTQIIALSSRMGIENLVLRVAGAYVGQPTEPGSLQTPRYVDHPQYEWESWEQEFLERVHGMSTGPGTAATRLLMASGDPATEILRAAAEKDVDLIVLPWHGVLCSGRARMVKTVMRHAACPILLMPERGERCSQVQ